MMLAVISPRKRSKETENYHHNTQMETENDQINTMKSNKKLKTDHSCRVEDDDERNVDPNLDFSLQGINVSQTKKENIADKTVAISTRIRSDSEQPGSSQDMHYSHLGLELSDESSDEELRTIAEQIERRLEHPSESNDFMEPHDVYRENDEERTDVNGIFESNYESKLPSHSQTITHDIIESFEDCDDSDGDPNYEPSGSSESSDEELHENANQSQLQGSNELNAGSKNEASSPTGMENRSLRKRKRNMGQPYKTATGKKICARKYEALESCRNGCKDKISYEQQKEIFEEYWKLGTYDKRAAYVAGLIQIGQKKVQKCRDECPDDLTSQNKSFRNRRYSCKYFLFADNKHIQVCQKCVRKTLGESEKFIRNVVQKMYSSPGAISVHDKRGRHPSSKKLSTTFVEEIKAHINSFPAYESHYSRRESSKKYLRGDLNISMMHRMFLEKSECKGVSLSKYTEIFNTMNLKFKPPALDTCNRCDTLHSKIKFCESHEKESFQAELTQHQKEADDSYKSKEQDKLKAKNCTDTKTLTFDLQQCLPTPFLKSSVCFYKRPLWTFNLTVHDCTSGQPYCYMWNESVGKRGGNEIASCVYQHLLSLSPEIKHVILYSDSCAGQNKNSYVSAMFKLFVENSRVQTIDHKFLVVGHTHMECDVDHALIERQKKKTTVNIHHPRDWYNFVRTVGVKRKMNVFEMDKSNIFDFASLAKNKYVWRKVDDDGNKFSWHAVRWLRYTKEFGTFQYKTSLDENEEFKSLKISKRGIKSVKTTNLHQAYNSNLKINAEKKKDLIDMLPLIDSTLHNFYLNLLTNNDPDCDPDLTSPVTDLHSDAI